MTKSLNPIPPVDAEDGSYRYRPIEPGKTALLSIDMQNMEAGKPLRERAKVEGTPEWEKRAFFERVENVVIPAQQRLQAAARAAGIEVIYTVIQSLTQDGRDRSLDHKISRLHAAKDSWEGAVIDEVAPVSDEIIIPKTASGIFNCTNIEYVLRNLGVEYLVVYGVVTDQCVESTVRDAADRGFMVTEIEDACATYTKDRHQRSIEAMDGHYARALSADAFIAELDALGLKTA